MTRTHVHEERFPAAPARLFALLHTPTAIRDWWSASRVIVLARPGGVWAATWGEPEDDPDYVTAATIAEFDPPHRMRLTEYRYQARAGPLPFDAVFETEFTVRPDGDGSWLRVAQSGFPAGPEGDAFLSSCDTGWRNTFQGIRRFLHNTSEADRTSP